jgi:hypothetical protein
VLSSVVSLSDDIRASRADKGKQDSKQDSKQDKSQNPTPRVISSGNSQNSVFVSPCLEAAQRLLDALRASSQ